MKKVYYNDNTVGLVNLTSEGGIPYVAGTGIDITNDVISVTGMTAESAFTAYTAATDTAIGNKADTTAMTQAISEATSGKVDTSTYTAYTAATDTAIGNKADTTAVTQSIDAATSGKADTTAVTEDISAAVSGKVDTTTYTAYTAATDSVLAGKQDTLSAGTGIDITDNVISVTGGGGGGCEVEETVVYDRITGAYSDDAGSNKALFVILDYLGDKSTGAYDLGFVIGDTSNNYVNAYINFDYPNHSSSSTDTGVTEYLTVEYVNDIQDFKVTIKPVYQSSVWIKQLYNVGTDMNLLVPFYTINSGSPCTVITTDVVGLVEKVKGTADKSLKLISVQGYGSKLEFTSVPNKGYSSLSTIKLEELDGSNNTLKPNINIPLGTSGWTELSLGSSCQFGDYYNLGFTTFRISGDTTALYSWGLQVSAGWEGGSYYWDNIQWNDNDNIFVRTTNRSEDVFSATTVDWDSNTGYLTVSYPQTINYNGQTVSTIINCLYSMQCQFGYNISKLEGYMEQTQPIKPFVQQLRTDVNTISGQVATKQDVLSAGTGIEISGNVISATGGGGMTEDDELLLSTALTDLNDRKIDVSEVKSNYQKKGDYVTTNALNTRLAEYETALDEQNVEEVTAYALNDLNERFGGLKIVKITESEYEALTTKDENTLYIVVADPS